MNDFNTPPVQNIPTINRQYQIPINSLFTQVFGIAGPLIRSYKIPPEEKKTKNLNYQVGQIDSPEVTQDTIKSSLGTPVNFWMAFVGGEYNKRISGEITQVSRTGMYLPFTSVATFSRAHRWTETFMSGQEGSVIEEYGFEPWDIRIQGFILRNDKNLVSGKSTIEDQVKELELYEGLSDAIGVKGRVFEWLGINKVAFGKIEYPAARDLNMEVVKPYEIFARSIVPLELIDI